jgi:uncharacterized protein (DUF983 family)
MTPRELKIKQAKVYGGGRIPPLIVCPLCHPGMISYAGVVISRVCSQCEEQLKLERGGK